jgi:hypothetical protein
MQTPAQLPDNGPMSTPAKIPVSRRFVFVPLRTTRAGEEPEPWDIPAPFPAHPHFLNLRTSFTGYHFLHPEQVAYIPQFPPVLDLLKEYRATAITGGDGGLRMSWFFVEEEGYPWERQQRVILKHIDSGEEDAPSGRHGPAIKQCGDIAKEICHELEKSKLFDQFQPYDFDASKRMEVAVQIVTEAFYDLSDLADLPSILRQVIDPTTTDESVVARSRGDPQDQPNFDGSLESADTDLSTNEDSADMPKQRQAAFEALDEIMFVQRYLTTLENQVKLPLDLRDHGLISQLQPQLRKAEIDAAQRMDYFGMQHGLSHHAQNRGAKQMRVSKSSSKTHANRSAGGKSDGSDSDAYLKYMIHATRGRMTAARPMAVAQIKHLARRGFDQWRNSPHDSPEASDNGAPEESTAPEAGRPRERSHHQSP